jgi:signal transduction histidine kinase
MNASGRWWAVVARPPMSDVLVAAGAAVLSCGPVLAYRRGQPPSAPAWSSAARLTVLGLALAGCAALLVRRRWPLPVLAWTSTTVLAAAPVVASTKFTALPLIVALYTVSAYRDWPVWPAAGMLGGLVLGSAQTFGGATPWDAATGLIWAAAPLAAGVAVRNRRGYVTAIQERARQAEASREDEARRRVAEERVRIARELHDVLAHSIAVIGIQSGVAAHLIASQPAKAQQALWHINDASNAALAELRSTIGLLRDSDEATAPTRPLPRLEQLDDLIDQVRATGLTVRTHLSGDLTRIPTEMSLVSYRVLQEALTNVIKHAQARAVELTVAADDHQLRLDVRDDGIGAAEHDCDGHGRIGMRERVHALGGVFRDGPEPTGYAVHAAIPFGPLTQAPE